MLRMMHLQEQQCRVTATARGCMLCAVGAGPGLKTCLFRDDCAPNACHESCEGHREGIFDGLLAIVQGIVAKYTAVGQQSLVFISPEVTGRGTS